MSVTPHKSALEKARKRLDADRLTFKDCACTHHSDLRLVLDALKEAERVADALKAEVERLCKVDDHWQSVAAGIRSERDALRAKLSASEREAERLRADVAKVCDDWVHGDTHTTDWLLSRLMPIAQRGFALRGEEAPRGE